MKLTPHRQLVLTFAPSVVVLLIVAVAAISLGVRIPAMTRDITTTAGMHPFTGFLSSLGILLWCVTASVCLFSAVHLRAAGSQHMYRFLLSAALLSAYLMFDDLFLIHDYHAAEYFGFRQRVVYAGILSALFTYLIVFRRTILDTGYPVLVLGLLFLGCSMFIDFPPLESFVKEQIGQWLWFIEDGAKWLGISCWCSYHVSTAYLQLSRQTVGVQAAPVVTVNA